MKINNKEFLNPQQQLYENTKDIEGLKSKIMEWYNATIELYENTTTVTRSYTNVPNDKNSGFLIDTYGHLYKIVGGDDTTLLVEYYSLLGQYTLVDNGGGSSAPQIYYHNINYKDIYNDAGMGNVTIDCTFIIPSTESTEFTYNDMADAVRYYLYPAWDDTTEAFPAKRISASGVIGLYDEVEDREIMVPIASIILQKDGASSVVAIYSENSSMPITHSTFTFLDETFNCVTDTVLSGLYSFPRPI